MSARAVLSVLGRAGDVQLAIGSFDAEYAREFVQYRKAETSARIRAFGDVR